MYVQAIHFVRSILNYNCLNFKRHVFTSFQNVYSLYCYMLTVSWETLSSRKWKRQMEPMTSKLFFLGLKSDVSL